MTNSDRLLMRVRHYRMMRPCRASTERMPFAGHRTMAEVEADLERDRLRNRCNTIGGKAERHWRKATMAYVRRG